jgi:hypothetical protein
VKKYFNYVLLERDIWLDFYNESGSKINSIQDDIAQWFLMLMKNSNFKRVIFFSSNRDGVLEAMTFIILAYNKGFRAKIRGAISVFPNSFFLFYIYFLEKIYIADGYMNKKTLLLFSLGLFL